LIPVFIRHGLSGYFTIFGVLAGLQRGPGRSAHRLAGEGHLPLAATPDPTSAAPITGGLEVCEVEFEHEMSVTRIFESARVTKPYTPEQWAEIETLGHRIDEDLIQRDVRLTMGGEPTFVSIDDMEGAEWNTAAVGPKKRELSHVLVKRLRKQFGPGGLLHFGQGKWYPGEQLPRWALGCYWRKDGVPMWRDDSLIGDESKNYGHSENEAYRFGMALSAALTPRICRDSMADAVYGFTAQVRQSRPEPAADFKGCAYLGSERLR
jgi:uncharacterized protein (DUF2126 family)